MNTLYNNLFVLLPLGDITTVSFSQKDKILWKGKSFLFSPSFFFNHHQNIFLVDLGLRYLVFDDILKGLIIEKVHYLLLVNVCIQYLKKKPAS